MNYIVTLLLVIIVAVVGYLVLQKSGMETFVPYKKKPFNEWDTGSDPLNYYTLPIYNKPYRYPFKYHTTYPYSYLRNYPTHLGN